MSFLVRWRSIYTRGRSDSLLSPVVLGVMADSRAASPNASLSGRSEARKGYDRKRNASRVCLFKAFERWRAFQDEHGLQTDKDIAEFLLDNYV